MIGQTARTFTPTAQRASFAAKWTWAPKGTFHSRQTNDCCPTVQFDIDEQGDGTVTEQRLYQGDGSRRSSTSLSSMSTKIELAVGHVWMLSHY